MDLADLKWRLIPEEARDGPTHMALEEVAARTAVEDGVGTVRAFTWEPSTLSLGYGQASETIDWHFCEREGIDVTRRQTGGGGIYHDREGDVSYTIVAPASAVPGDLMASYELLCTPIFDAFARMGVDARFAEDPAPALHQPACYLRAIDPAHDVLVDGRKISGNAQYRQRDAVIQHGSLTYDRRTERHLGVFADPETTPERFRERVTSIREVAGIDRTDTVEALEAALGAWVDAEPGAWSEDELDAAAALVDEKYANDAWVERTASAD